MGTAPHRVKGRRVTDGPGPLSRVMCPQPGCAGWYSGRPGVAGCRACYGRAYKLARKAPPKPRPAPPVLPCPTPGCAGTYAGRSKSGCGACQDRAVRARRKALRLCLLCVKPLHPAEPHRCCKPCRARYAALEREKRQSRVEDGLCVSCPRKASTHAVKCRRCLDGAKASRDRARERRCREAG